MAIVAETPTGGRRTPHLDHLVALGHDRSELEWEAVELVIGGIGEAAQQAWSEDPENWTAEEIADEMATRRWEARRDEFGY